MAKKKKKTHPEVHAFTLLSIIFLAVLSLWSFNINAPLENWLGYVGHFIAFGLQYIFGLGSVIFLTYLTFLAYKIFIKEKLSSYGFQICYFSIFLFCLCILLNVYAEMSSNISTQLEKKIYFETITSFKPLPKLHHRFYLGGVPFYYLYKDIPYFNLKTLLSNVGVILIFALSAFISFLLFTRIQLLRNIYRIRSFILSIFTFFRVLKNKAKYLRLKKQKPPIQKPLLKQISRRAPTVTTTTITQPYEPPFSTTIPQAYEPPSSTPITVNTLKNSVVFKKPIQSNFTGAKKYRLPDPSLLTDPIIIDQSTVKKDLQYQAKVLEETLESFGIAAKVGQIHCGPTITSFEVHPPVGVKVQKIKALENDIALNMQAKSIRIIAPIPGKAAVGVEIPAIHRQEVSFKQMLYHYQESSQKMQIPIFLGQTVQGENVITDLIKMPHCLIAGATGSGKSVCINTLVMSILMTAHPEEVKLMMIDPKKVELTQYSNLPHMIAPVISEAHGAYAALQWLVKEMQSRYDILKKLGLRNINAFNKRKIKKDEEEDIPERLPYIVCIIDEFADLMMVSSSDLETPIARIAQMARAIGIHLILATQRPSREVITGIIKANFPCRIAFKVASRINSQIILDETGAESLLGNGDLLFLPPGSSQLVRAQGAYISDEEINECVEAICRQLHTNYLIPSFDHMNPTDPLLGGMDPQHKDEFYDRAYDIVISTKNASTTFLQRKLKIGYARAASLMDELEENGVIGPQEGSKPRRVLENY